MPDLGTIRRIDPREVWPSESRDFTPWLAEHLDQLGELLGLDLDLVRRESAVGDFLIDILARDLGRDRLVVIENQLESTDHTHIGQVITYAAGVDAGAVVWISRDFRDEHRQAIDWLNRNHGEATRFFGVAIELLKVDDSRPAPNLKLVAVPNDWSHVRGTSKDDEEVSGRRQAYQNFFQSLIDRLREDHRFTNARVGQPQNWYTFSAGVRGFGYSISFAAGHRLRAELYIDVGDADRNQAILEELRGDAQRIEAELGESLTWEPLEAKRACRIAIYREGSIEDPGESIENYCDWAVDHMVRLKRVLGPRIERYRATAE